MRENPKVKEQYKNWPYPPPVYDLNEYFSGGQRQRGCPSSFRSFYSAFPRSKKSHLSILVAGCGAYQAAAIAYKNPDCKVQGIDISETSLNLTNDLKAKHHLSNLELAEMSLLDLSSSINQYDYIISTGVIHHLPSPLVGLEALKSALSPDGAMYLMVYGSTLRYGVYLLQSAFRCLQIDPQTVEEVEQAIGFIKSLPNRHPVHRYIKVAPDLNDPGGVIDTFFHSQDTSYTIDELFTLVKRAGLNFNGFCNNAEYNHSFILSNALQNAYPSKINEMSFFEQARVVDLLGTHRGTHFFTVSKGEKFNLSDTEIPDEFAEAVPKIIDLVAVKHPQNGGTIVRQPGFPSFAPSKTMLNVMRLIDGVRTFEQIMELLSKANAKLTEEQCEQVVFIVARDLWMKGNLIFVG